VIYSASISIKRGTPVPDIDDKKLVEDIATLARIDFEEGEIGIYASQMRAILDHFDDLKEIDLTGINPTVQIHHVDIPLAEDNIEPGLSINDGLNASHRRRGNLLSVPRIVNPDAHVEGE
jgi:aspartyl-tRNA(Asn)/glutamyl-tRNA(Gln) amidotransferase subunit C